METEVSLHNSKVPAPVPILSQLHAVHTNTSYFLKIIINIILPSISVSPHWCLSPTFPHPVHAAPIPHTRYMPPPLYFILLNFITLKNIRRKVHMMLFIMYFPPIHSFLALLVTIILLNTLFRNVSLCSSPNVIDQVSHPYKKQNYNSGYPNLQIFR